MRGLLPLLCCLCAAAFASDTRIEPYGPTLVCRETPYGYVPMENLLYKMQKGEKITIGVIGDSIGYGQVAGSTTIQGITYSTRPTPNGNGTPKANPMSYARVLTDYLKDYAKANYGMDDAKIDTFYSVWGGATAMSSLGYASDDIVAYRPDVVLVEIWNLYGDTSLYLESILQILYAANPHADVILLGVGGAFGKFSAETPLVAKYGIPYFANFVNSEMDPDDARSMCCRLRLDKRELNRRGGGLFGANPQTGSIGVVTINMARLGYLAEDEDTFIERLDELMAIARNSLEIKRKLLERFTAQDLYPYTRFYLRQVFERFGLYWQNHFSTIGLLGLNEGCLNLFGEDIGTDRGQAFALRVMDFMRDRLADYQEETGNLYNLEATPAEGTTYRLAQLDKKMYPDIITASEQGGEPFYSNSTQLPVSYSDDILNVLELQDEIQTKYTGGTVVHVFTGEAVSNPDSVKAFVRMICKNFHLPYFTVSPTFSICEDHGYISGEHYECPRCKKNTEVYSRVVGYIRPVQQWNAGKQHEFAMRKTYQVAEATAAK